MADDGRITAEQLAAMIAYDPDTGDLTWLPRDRKFFATSRSQL